MTLKDAQKIYFVGIKGFGMASLAVVLKGMGKHVMGSDIETHFPTQDLLEREGIEWVIGFEGSNVPDDTDFIIVTGAHGGLHNPEVVAAQRRGISVLTHGEALGQTMDLFEDRVAVCGTHGKTTTSALLSYALHTLGAEFAYQVGTSEFSGLPGGGFTGKRTIVVESDEYHASPGIDDTPRFMYQNPTSIICTSVEYDHPDVYPTYEDYKHAFTTFFAKLQGGKGTLIYCIDDAGARVVAESVEGITKVSYGFSGDADYMITETGPSEFLLQHAATGQSLSVHTSLFGRHNMLNAAAVMIQLLNLGYESSEIEAVLRTFTSSKLRFNILYESTDYAVVDDYAHHPTEIRALLDSARSKYPKRRIVLIFQPHMVSRTQALKADFIEAMHSAEVAYLLDIFRPQREDAAEESLTSEQIVEEAHAKGYTNINYISESDGLTKIYETIKPADVVVFAGANDKFKLHQKLIEKLA